MSSTRSFAAVVAPACALIARVGIYLRAEPSGDEVDVIPGTLVVASVVAVAVCIAGAAFGRRRWRSH